MYDSSQTQQLLDALVNDDLESFSSILDQDVWPIDSSECLDYDLLMKAITLKRLRFVDYFLDKNCRVYIKPGIQTPLHLAVSNDGALWFDIVSRLIARKCPIDEKHTRDGGKGDTAVHVAFHEGSNGEEIVDLLLRSYLLKNQRNVENVANDDGLSFLHIACSRPSVNVVQKLLKADPQALDLSEEISFFTPLHFAVQYRRYAVAEYLLNGKAKIYKQNCDKSTPLHLALKLRDLKMINLILNHDQRKENVVDEFGLTHFMAACASNNRNIVQEYLKLGAHIAPNEFINAKVNNLEGHEGYTPLHYAVDFGLETRAVELLLEHGADCCAAALNAMTPHTIARDKGHDLMCNLLNEHCHVFKGCQDNVATFLDFDKNILKASAAVADPSPEVPDNQKQSRFLSILPGPRRPPKESREERLALPYAFYPVDLKARVARCNSGAVRSKPKSPEIPVEKQLFRAIKNNKTDEFLTILKSKGCPKDSTVYELLKAAIILHRKPIVMALLDNPDCPKMKPKTTWKGLTPLHMAATILDWSDVVEKLLETGYGKSDDNFNYNKYGTPMELAYNAGNVNSTVDVLLKHAIDNGIIEAGYLHIACTRPNLEIAKKYLQSDSIVYSINSQYFSLAATPLHFAVMHKRHEIARYLIESGADIYLQDRNGSTPLHLALVLKDVQMIDLILAFDTHKINLIDEFGTTHFMAACAGTNSRLVQEYLQVALFRFNVSPITLIFDKIKIFTQTAISGYTSLHFATYCGRVNTVELLLTYAADCCLKAADGKNCHEIAWMMGNKQVYGILKEHCDIVRRCKETRAQSPDFNMWDDTYEWNVLLERTKTLKSLRGTLRNFRSIRLVEETIDIDD